MNTRLSLAAVLIVFMYPICTSILAVNEAPPLLRWFVCLGYVFDTVYLMATGFKQR